MSKKEEEDPNPYRSGVFVMGSSKKDDKNGVSKPTMIREEYRDLHDILMRLSLNVRENTTAIKMLIKSAGKEDIDTQTLPETQPADVRVRCNFLRVIDVDTKHNKFQAEVLIHATWHDPDCQQRSGKPSWVPQFNVLNVDGQPSLRKSWSGIKDIPRSKCPVHYYCLKLRAYFREDFELRAFPVDHQELSVVVSCSVPKTIITLHQDESHPSYVLRDTFDQGSEFTLHNHVIVQNLERNKWDMDMSHLGHSVLKFQCHVSRRPGYYAINIMLFLFLIVGLTFSSYVLPLTETKDRLMVALTIFLTAVAFQFKVNADLPTLSYVTYLGGFILMNMLFLISHIIGIASIAIANTLYGTVYATEVDKYLFVVFMLIYCCINTIYIGFIIIKFLLNRSAMVKADEDCSKKRRESKPEDLIYYDAQEENYAETQSMKKKSRKKSKRRSAEVDPERGHINNGQIMIS